MAYNVPFCPLAPPLEEAQTTKLTPANTDHRPHNPRCPSIPFYPTHCRSLTYRNIVSHPNKPHLTHLPIPRPLKKNTILIKVHFAALNPADTKFLNFPLLSYFPGEKALGRDLSGTIVGVGSGVKNWKIGDEVIVFLARNLWAPGSLTDYLVVDLKKVVTIVRKPENVGWEEAAGLPLVALTGFTVLEWLPELGRSSVGKENSTSTHEDQGNDGGDGDAGESRRGRREVLVIGASGGVGIVTIQLTQILHNCRITGICSSRNSEYVKTTLHADKVIEYDRLPEETPTLSSTLLSETNKPLTGHYDLIIDCVGETEILNIYPMLLHKNGAYVTIVGPNVGRHSAGGPMTYLTHPQQIFWYLKGEVLGPRYGNVFLKPRKEWLQLAVDLLAQGKLRVEIEKVVDNGRVGGWESEKDGWGEGFRILDSGRCRGKVVIKITDPGLDRLTHENANVNEGGVDDARRGL